MKTMTSGMWCRVLMEFNITHRLTASGREEPIHCRIEIKNPDLDWERIWTLATTFGLSSAHLTCRILGQRLL
jgi:hypothetical protein